MPATTTQRTEAGYLLARAAYYEAQAAAYDADADRYDADPYVSEAVRKDMTSYYRASAEMARQRAAEDREAAGTATCLACGGRGRIADFPCAYCCTGTAIGEALSPANNARSLAACGAEVRDGR